MFTRVATGEKNNGGKVQNNHNLKELKEGSDFLDRSLETFVLKPKDLELMRWWATDEHKKDDRELHHPSDTQ